MTQETLTVLRAALGCLKVGYQGSKYATYMKSISEMETLIASLEAAQPVEQPALTDEQIKAEFGKLYPNDLPLIELAANNRDFALEAIGARHHWTAFKSGARAIEQAIKGVK